MPTVSKKCIGCDTLPPPGQVHPYVAVMREPATAPYKHFPVCELCFTNPANRKRVLKAHFHFVQFADPKTAAAEAGRNRAPGSPAGIGG